MKITDRGFENFKIINIVNFIQDKGISAFPDGDNLLSWVGTVVGPQVGRSYRVQMEERKVVKTPTQSN